MFTSQWIKRAVLLVCLTVIVSLSAGCLPPPPPPWYPDHQSPPLIQCVDHGPPHRNGEGQGSGFYRSSRICFCDMVGADQAEW